MIALRRTGFRLQRWLGGMLEGLVDRPFGWRALARASGRAHVLCLGDSHVAVMRHVHVPGVWFRAKPLMGATASGVMNPQSRTNSLRVFDGYLARAGRWQQVLLELGEVDCGFVIWHRAQRLGLDVEEQLRTTIGSYGTFIRKVAALGFERVIVLSVPLPTIGDDPSRWGEVANMRKAVSAGQRERTELTLRFNAALEQLCAETGVVFVDVTSGHHDRTTGLIAQDFVRGTQDHHLRDGPFAALIARELSPLFAEGAAPRGAQAR